MILVNVGPGCQKGHLMSLVSHMFFLLGSIHRSFGNFEPLLLSIESSWLVNDEILKMVPQNWVLIA